MYWILIALVYIVTSSWAQLHPDDQAVTCFNCDATLRHKFPLCLHSPIKCDRGDVCMIRYSHGSYRELPTIGCRSTRTCNIHLIGHPLPCDEGGFHRDPGVCEACCDSNECVGDLTNYIRLNFVSSKNLFCPGRCHVNDVQTCVHAGRLCNHDAFCEVKIDNADIMYGLCLDDSLYSHCQDRKRSHRCPDDFQNQNAYDGSNKHYCYHDCCANNECLFPHFGIHMANAVSPTNIPPAASTLNSSGLWEKLRGSCEDQFDLALCQSLKNDHDLCKSRLHLSMCPQTCGICSAVGSYVCEDRSSVCTALKSQPGFCTTDEGLFECPTSCGKCDQLIDSVILSIVDGSVTVPPQLTTPPPMDCSSIKPEDCVHFGPLCQTTFLGVVCPAQCDFCANGEAASA